MFRLDSELDLVLNLDVSNWCCPECRFQCCSLSENVSFKANVTIAPHIAGKKEIRMYYFLK